MTTRKNTFLLKRSNVPGKVPSPGDLQLGELALNTADAILYTSGTTANSILPIGWDRLSTLSGGTVNGNVTINGFVSATTYYNLPSFSGEYLPLSGGTVYGNTIFTSGLTANTIYTDYIDFNTTPTVPNPTGGTLYFDSNENALSYKPITNQNDVTVNLGQESLIRIYNDLPTTILNGQVLHITGATSGVPTVALANASNLGITFTESLAQTSGVATHDIPSGEYGFMTNFGIVRDLNTTAFTVGQEVFLSDTIDGALTNDPNNIAFTSRISTVGYCLESNATTGKILVVITNENPLQSLTQQEINVLLGNTISTGTYFYTGATTASTTTINVSPMRGWIVYNTGPTYATSPLVLNIYYSGGTNLPVSGLTSSFDTYLLVNSGGTLYQTNTFPSPQERRQNIFLGRVVHPNKTTILNVEQSVDYDVSPLSSLRDLWVPIKIINEGVVPSPNGATLTFKTSSGTFWGNGIGFPTDELNPNAITVPAYIPASFYYTTQSGGTFTATTTTVDTLNYDVGGVITLVPGAGNYTTQRIYMSQSGVIRLQYGQEYYSTLAKAIAAIPSETFVVNPDNSIDCTLIGLLTVKDGTGDLSNTDDAIFTFVSKFGEILGGTGGISTTTLQQAYNNSINPEITTNTILGGVQFRGGTGNDADKNIIIENNSSVETAYIRADGKALFNTISATTIGGSGSCVTNLYVSNISSCSPLNIQPNNEGNVYFGSTSAVTIDLSNKRLGIGTPNPEYRLDISGTTGRFFTNIDSDTEQQITLSAKTTSGITDIAVLSPNAGGILMGIRGVDQTLNPGFGKAGDSFIYSSAVNNGLNIISQAGSGTDDYIRFYAGQLATTGNTPDLYIQGSGSTRGYVGIGTGSPQYRLDISGTTGRLFYDGDTTRNTYRQSQIINQGPSTGITAISVASEGSGNQIELFSIGSGVLNSILWRFAGEPNDVALYASSSANNLNIINNVGSGTTDNIRFYVGGSGHITGQTPSMIIIGSGSTKGYVGIGTTSPTEKLYVSGNTYVSGEITTDSVVTMPNFKYIQNKNDFPTAIGGIITLSGDTTYFINTTVDLTGDRLVAGQNTTILGGSSENSRLKSTGLSGTALLSSAWSIPMRGLTIESDVALNLDAGGNANQAIDWFGVNFTNCNTIGLIKDYSNIIWTDCAILESANLTFSGTIATIGFGTCLFNGISGNTIFNIPSGCSITRRFRPIYSSFIVLPGETGITISNSAIVNNDGFILDTINFAGGGTYISGLDSTSAKSLFSNNVGILNSSNVGHYYMINNTTNTTIGVPNVNVWVKAAGTTTLGIGNSPRWVANGNNRLDYTGNTEQDFKFTAVGTVQSSSNNQVISVGLAINGTIQIESEITVRTSNSNQPYPFAIQDLAATLSAGAYIEVFVLNTQSPNIRVGDLNVIIDKISV